MSIGRGIGGPGEIPFASEEQQAQRRGVKRRGEQGDEPPKKRVKVTTEDIVKTIQKLSSLDDAQFQTAEHVDKLIHSLFLKVTSDKWRPTRGSIKTLTNALKNLSRITEHPLLDEATKKNCVKELHAVRAIIEGKKPESIPNATLLIGDTKIPVNKEFLAAASPYFKALFESAMQKGVSTHLSHTTALLHDVDPKMVKNCLEALTGNFDVSQIKDINTAVSLLQYAERFTLSQVAEDTAKALQTCIQKLSLDDFPENQSPLQIMADLVEALQPCLAPQHHVALQESIAKKCLDFLTSLGKKPKELPPTLLKFIPLVKLLVKNYLTENEKLMPLLIKKPEEASLDDAMNFDECYDLLSSWYPIYKTIPNDAYRQITKKFCEILLEREGIESRNKNPLVGGIFDILIDTLLSGSIDEQNQAKELLSTYGNKDNLYPLVQKLIQADIVYKAGNNPQEAIAELKKILMSEASGGGYNFLFIWRILAFYLSQQHPLPIEDMKEILVTFKSENSSSPFVSWYQYLIDKQDNPQLVLSREVLDEMRKMTSVAAGTPPLLLYFIWPFLPFSGQDQ